jgi:hypothetical protein
MNGKQCAFMASLARKPSEHKDAKNAENIPVAFLDKTLCASPNCINECGRKMTDSERGALAVWGALMNPSNDPHVIVPVCYAYFCGEPEIKPILDSSFEPQEKIF